jgi:hypothetical protein
VCANALCGFEHRALLHLLASPEHSDLQFRAVRVMLTHQCLAYGLDHEVDVTRLAIRVRPEARVYLPRAIPDLGCRERYGARDARQRRAKLGRLLRVEIGKVDHVSGGLDNDGSHAEGSDAVLDDPVAEGRNTAAGNPFRTLDQLAGEAVHVVSQRR